MSCYDNAIKIKHLITEYNYCIIIFFYFFEYFECLKQKCISFLNSYISTECKICLKSETSVTRNRTNKEIDELRDIFPNLNSKYNNVFPNVYKLRQAAINNSSKFSTYL